MKAVYGLYRDPAAAQRAVDSLSAAGVASRGITVVSSEPFEAYPFSARDRSTPMWAIAVAGGLVGALIGAWLARLTEVSWPMKTGGMPIVPTWPNLIIIFEMTMLSAMLTTVVTMLVTTGLPRRRPLLYDAAVADGLILVGVESVAARDELQRALDVDGVARIRTID